MTAILLSIQVGLPVRYETEGAAAPMDRPWRSAIAERAVEGPVSAERTNLAGDAQADLEVHGRTRRSSPTLGYKQALLRAGHPVRGLVRSPERVLPSASEPASAI